MTSSAAETSLKRWRALAVAAFAVVVLVVPLSQVVPPHRSATIHDLTAEPPTFVGRARCASCHAEANRAWQGSDHDWAMTVASDSTVLGDFDDVSFEHRGIRSRFERRDGRYYVQTEGPAGRMEEYEIAYTFGYEPLQQYLVRFPGGRLQALSIAWDTEARRWFHLYPDQDIPPDDWMHWTRNAQNWNGMCAECHSTNLRKNYDAATDSYTTTWSEIDVSCEACHGPGSRHVAWAEVPPMARPVLEHDGLVLPTSGITARQEVELCAPCHSRRTELGDYDHRRPPLMDNQVPALLEEDLYHADGQILEEVYVYGSFVQSKMFQNDVRCSDCHDVHNLRLRAQDNSLCTGCHQADAYDTSEHHFHKKVYEGKPNEGARCIRCHMPETTYMVVDERADHSLRVPRPDLTLRLGVPNACNQSGCHADKSATWAAKETEVWYGKARKPHYGTLLAAGRQHDAKARPALRRLAADPLHPTIVRATALSLLGRDVDATGIAAWREALMDDEPLLRYTAVQNVTLHDSAEMADLLGPLLFDPVRAVRLEAAARLVGPPAAHLEPYQREALDEHVTAFQHAMEYSLDFAFAGLNLGNLYERMGDAARAEAYYRRAIGVDDLFYPAKMNLAVLLDGQGRTEEAVTLLRQVVDAYPDHAGAAYSLALGLAGLQRYEEAERYLATAAAGMPDNPRVHYNHGLLLQQLNRDDAARASLERALELQPESFDTLYALAGLYAKLGRLEDAKRMAERLQAAHPEQSAGRELQAWIRSQQGAP